MSRGDDSRTDAPSIVSTMQTVGVVTTMTTSGLRKRSYVVFEQQEKHIAILG